MRDTLSNGDASRLSARDSETEVDFPPGQGVFAAGTADIRPEYDWGVPVEDADPWLSTGRNWGHCAISLSSVWIRGQ